MFGKTFGRLSGKSKKAVAVIIAVIMAGSLGACTNTDAPDNAKESSGNDEIIRVVTLSSAAPFAWRDPETGKPTGYFVDVANAIDEKVAGVKIEWSITDFPAGLAGLSTDQYDAMAFNVGKTPEREKRYLYSDASISVGRHSILYNKSKFDNINSLHDLASRKLKVGTVSTGSTDQLLLEKYNKDHPDAPLDLQHGDYGLSELVTAVQNGQIDATVVGDTVAYAYEKERHDDSLAIIPFGEAGEGYYIFGKSKRGEAAKVSFDKAISELKKDGTIKKISLKYFGKDVSK